MKSDSSYHLVSTKLLTWRSCRASIKCFQSDIIFDATWRNIHPYSMFYCLQNILLLYELKKFLKLAQQDFLSSLLQLYHASKLLPYNIVGNALPSLHRDNFTILDTHRSLTCIDCKTFLLLSHWSRLPQYSDLHHNLLHTAYWLLRNDLEGTIYGITILGLIYCTARVCAWSMKAELRVPDCSRLIL